MSVPIRMFWAVFFFFFFFFGGDDAWSFEMILDFIGGYFLNANVSFLLFFMQYFLYINP